MVERARYMIQRKTKKREEATFKPRGPPNSPPYRRRKRSTQMAKKASTQKMTTEKVNVPSLT